MHPTEPHSQSKAQSGPGSVLPLRLIVSVVVLVLISMLLLSVLENSPQPPMSAMSVTDTDMPEAWREIEPVPLVVPVDEHKRLLGKRLYKDARLSPVGQSCNGCHDLKHYGTLRQSLSPNLLGGFDLMNIPSTYNSALNASQGWRGNSRDLSDQLSGVINNPRHMGSNWPYVLQQLSDDAEYREAFTKAYGEGPNQANVTDAIVTFENTLLTPNAPFDRYLRGERDALNKQQLRGYKKFRDFGCVACHQGVNVGGNLMARYGIFDDPFADHEDQNDMDLGRFSITGLEADKHVFKVPSLRNITQTAPYSHDGSVETLREMVARMGHYQLGRMLNDDDLDDLLAFLESLTAPLPEAAL